MNACHLMPFDYLINRPVRGGCEGARRSLSIGSEVPPSWVSASRDLASVSRYIPRRQADVLGSPRAANRLPDMSLSPFLRAAEAPNVGTYDMGDGVDRSKCTYCGWEIIQRSDATTVSECY